MSQSPPRWIAQNEVLAPHTTIGLGGRARYFARCRNIDELREALAYAQEMDLPVQVMAGGSNIIFDDRGFDGLIIMVDLRGVRAEERTDTVALTAASGEMWDEFVRSAVDRGWGGIECLSGIPGSVGATPIQNVGAYGQEVGETIVALRALDRRSRQLREFAAADCGFGYRQSRFKGPDADRFIVTEVQFLLRKNATADIRYPELRRVLEQNVEFSKLGAGRATLRAVREAVISLRRAKSMVLDTHDADARSVGSFFMNPVLSQASYRSLCARWQAEGDGSPLPSFPAPDGVKIPAGWLVEHAGFSRGYVKGGAGISTHHALAIVNRGGSSREVLELAEDIQRAVNTKFGVLLGLEPAVVPFRPQSSGQQS